MMGSKSLAATAQCFPRCGPGSGARQLLGRQANIFPCAQIAESYFFLLDNRRTLGMKCTSEKSGTKQIKYTGEHWLGGRGELWRACSGHDERNHPG